MEVSDLAAMFEDAGVAAIIYTDIDRDGTGKGLNMDSTIALAQATNIPVIASGGVASLADVRAVRAAQRHGVTGMIIGTALFLALALNYPVKKIAGWLPGKSRLGGTALAFTSLIVFLIAMVWFVVPPIVQQSAKFAATIPALVDQANEQWHGVGRFIDENGLREQVDTAAENVKQQAAGIATKVGTNILSSFGSLASFIASLFLVIVLAFLMLLEGPEWMRRIWGLYNDQEKMIHHRRLADKVYNVVTGYINGQLTVSGIGSLVAGLFVFGMSFFVAEIDANLAMPTILLTFVLSLIPMFGATLAGGLVTLLLALNSITAAIVYLVFFIIYQQIENNFISPAIQAKKSRTLGTCRAGRSDGWIVC
jgi:predicted PurR-regulated permease PerM